jgi:hypothetical protein
MDTHLLEGRDRPPAILCGHTPEYYVGILEEYGFKSARGSNLHLREINMIWKVGEIKQPGAWEKKGWLSGR